MPCLTHSAGYGRLHLLPLAPADGLNIAYQASPAAAVFPRDSQDHKLLELLVSRTLKGNPSAIQAVTTAFQLMSSYTGFIEFCLQIWGIIPADQHVSSLYQWTAETNLGKVLDVCLGVSQGAEVDIILSFSQATSRINVDMGLWPASDTVLQVLQTLQYYGLVSSDHAKGVDKSHSVAYVVNPILPFALASFAQRLGRQQFMLEEFSHANIAYYIQDWADGNGVNLARVRASFSRDPVHCFKVFFVSIDAIGDVAALHVHTAFATTLTAALTPGLETESNLLLRILFEKWIEKSEHILSDPGASIATSSDTKQLQATLNSVSESKTLERCLSAAVSLSTWLYFDHSLRQSPRSVLIAACDTVLKHWNHLRTRMSTALDFFNSDIVSEVSSVILLTIECVVDQPTKARSMLATVRDISDQMPAGPRRKSTKENYERSTLRVDLVDAIMKNDQPGIARIVQSLRKLDISGATSKLARSTPDEGARELLTEITISTNPKSTLAKLRDKAPHYAAAALLEAYQVGNASTYLSKVSAPKARTQLLQILAGSMDSSATQFLARKVLQLDAERRKDMHEALGHCEGLALLAQERVDIDPWERDQLSAESYYHAGQIAFFDLPDQRQKGIDYIKAAGAIYDRHRQMPWGCKGTRKQLISLHIMYMISTNDHQFTNSESEPMFLVNRKAPQLAASQFVDLLCVAYESPPVSIANARNIAFSTAFDGEKDVDLQVILSTYVQEDTISKYLRCGAFTWNLVSWYIYDLDKMISEQGNMILQKRAVADDGIHCLAAGIACEINDLEEFLKCEFEPAYARLLSDPEACVEKIITLETGPAVELTILPAEELVLFKELEMILFGRETTNTDFKLKYFDKDLASQVSSRFSWERSCSVS